MAFNLLNMKYRPLEEVVRALEAEFERELKVGDKLPPQQKAGEVFGISQAGYSKAVRILAGQKKCIRIEGGGVYVWGIPDKGTMQRLRDEEHRRRTSLTTVHKGHANHEEVARKGMMTRSLRNEVRAQVANAILKEGIAKHVVQALREHDISHMICCEKALKMVGATFDQSEEASEMLKKAGITSKNEVTAISFNFIPANGDPGQAIEAVVVEDADEN